jgi:hypothetical protein
VRKPAFTAGEAESVDVRMTVADRNGNRRGVDFGP